MKIQKKNLGGGSGSGWGGGGGAGGVWVGLGGVRVVVNEELKFLRKFKKKKFGGGTVGRAWRVGLGGSGWM